MSPAVLDPLPVFEALPAIRQYLSEGNALVLSAPPGSGKTTAVPLELLAETWLQGRAIVMLEPRRLAARAAAHRMASLLGEAAGERVGYRTRFDAKTSARTRIEIVTEGILVRRLQSDPELQGVGLVIFDEFHERNLHADLALALCLDAQSALRPDLRLMLMSATLDTDAACALLGGAPLVEALGRSYPVEVRYNDQASDKDVVEQTLAGVRRALRETEGDVLVFLPGVGEIRSVANALEGTEALVCPLYGDLSRAQQDRAILADPGGRRRVVLSTSIAETSVTIEGVSTVVDSGWSRLPRFDPNTGLTRLETVPVSRAAADQRAGRAGRTRPGVTYRLWTRIAQARLPAMHKAEILDSDLAPLALELACWGVSDPSSLRWINPPPSGAYSQARDLLDALGALEGGRLSRHGERMARLGLHPRLAHMLATAGRGPGFAEACDVAALLSERDILRRVPGEALSCDLELRLARLQAWRMAGRIGRIDPILDAAACRRVDQLSHSWRRRTGADEGVDEGVAVCGDHAVAARVALAYPDRVARRVDNREGRYLLASGRMVRLDLADPLNCSEYLAVAHLDAGRSEGRVFLAAAIEREHVEQVLADHVRSEEVVRWNAASGAVECRREQRLGALVLSSREWDRAPVEAVRSTLLEGIRKLGIACLPWTDAAREWQARLACLRLWQAQFGWPDCSDDALLADLDSWLAPYLEGMSRIDHLRRLDMLAILRSRLDWTQQQDMDRLVPSHIQVPSGSRKRLEYHPGSPPVLAVKLQEMFGQRQTPAVCVGRVPVMLQLLSPAQRPIQVTQDLEGFWSRTYPEVKKELKGRYPKHYWPEDPWSAIPTARVRPK